MRAVLLRPPRPHALPQRRRGQHDHQRLLPILQRHPHRCRSSSNVAVQILHHALFGYNSA